MTKFSKNTQEPQYDKTAVKSRFFAQYWGQKVGLFKKGNYSNPTGTIRIVDGSLITASNIESYSKTKIALQLKPLSKITNEDAEKLQYTLVNLVGLDVLIRQNSIELVKEVVSNYEQIDCLFMLPSSFSDLARELGYAIDWNNHKVSKQIELGWVQLL